MTARNGSTRGFTLLELLVVIVIIGLRASYVALAPDRTRILVFQVASLWQLPVSAVAPHHSCFPPLSAFSLRWLN